MNVRRLLKLADILEDFDKAKKKLAKIPYNRKLDSFDMRSWCEVKREDDRGQPLKEGFCKTSACALGTAALYPGFIRAGLTLKPAWPRERSVFLPSYKRRYGAEAGRLFFDLDDKQAERLFHGRGSTKTVAARIRRMVEKARK